VLVQQLANNPQDVSNKSAGMVGMSSIDQFTLGDIMVWFLFNEVNWNISIRDT
jgi:hypothetical protein